MELRYATEISAKETVQSSWRRRALKISLWVVGVPIALAVLLTIYFYIGGIEWGDWTIPNEADLRLEVREAPDEDNAYLALCALTNVCHLLTEEDSSMYVNGRTEYPDPLPDIRFVRYYGNRCDGDYEDEEMQIVREVRCNSEKARRILADNAAFFDAFHKALCRKGFWAKKENVGEYRPFVSYDFLVYRTFVRCAQLVEFRTQIAFEKGDMASSSSGICEMHALGQMISTNADTLVGYLAGDLIEKMAYRKMCEAVADRNVTDEAIGRFIKMIDAVEANAQLCWERAIKAELASRVKAIEFIFNRGADSYISYWEGEQRLIDAGKKRRMGLGKRILWKWPGLFKFCYHPREMIHRQTEQYRLMMAHAEPQVAKAEWWRSFVPGGAGRIWADNTLPDFTPYFIVPCLNRTRLRLVLAAERWRRAHGGENPPTLGALVPDYLAAVPRDPWSKKGAPINYDASLGVAWSVGKDGTYDYRKIAKSFDPLEKDSQEKRDTNNFAFRLDGKPIGLYDSTERGTMRPRQP